MIDEELLIFYGAEHKKYDAGEVIFSEGDHSSYYFQIVNGIVKLNNYSETGKEFTQWFANADESLLETALILDKPYPANAVAVKETQVLRLKKNDFFLLLNDHLEIYKILYKNTAEHIQYKYLMLEGICLQNPENKLKNFMDYLKNQHLASSPISLEIPFTRKQMASLTGLSVETVIRVIKKMEKNKILSIKNRKIFY